MAAEVDSPASLGHRIKASSGTGWVAGVEGGEKKRPRFLPRATGWVVVPFTGTRKEEQPGGGGCPWAEAPACGAGAQERRLGR